MNKHVKKGRKKKAQATTQHKNMWLKKIQTIFFKNNFTL
jgi:hypothetical protein